MSESNISHGLCWLGFWIFLSVMFYCSHVEYLQGHDTYFHKHKTEEEKEIQKIKIEKLRDGHD